MICARAGSAVVKHEMYLPGFQFSAECRPPVPARKAMLVRSGLSGSGCAQFQTQAPQWTHFSRSKFGTPASPSVMACPEQASMQIFTPHFSHSSGLRNSTWSA